MEKAIELYTTGSAYAEFMEDRKGRIKKGYLADVVIFDRDLLNIPSDQVMAARVDARQLAARLSTNDKRRRSLMSPREHAAISVAWIALLLDGTLCASPGLTRATYSPVLERLANVGDALLVLPEYQALQWVSVRCIIYDTGSSPAATITSSPLNPENYGGLSCQPFLCMFSGRLPVVYR